MAATATTPTGPIMLVMGNEPLTPMTVDEGKAIENLNEAFSEAMKAAVRSGEKASVVLRFDIGPDKSKEAEPGSFVVNSSVKKTLPAVKTTETHQPGSDNTIYTDLKSLNKVLRPIGGGQFEDVVSGDVVTA